MPPVPDHGAAAVSVSEERIVWAVLGPRVALWRPPAPPTVDPHPATSLSVDGWRGVTDRRVERTASRERVAYLDAVASQDPAAPTLHDAYVRAVHRTPEARPTGTRSSEQNAYVRTLSSNAPRSEPVALRYSV